MMSLSDPDPEGETISSTSLSRMTSMMYALSEDVNSCFRH